VTIEARAQPSVLRPLADRCREADIAGSSQIPSLRHAIKVVKRSGHRECGLNEAKSWADDNRPNHSLTESPLDRGQSVNNTDFGFCPVCG